MRHALVTGAAGAIGAALARVLRARDARLALSLVDVDPRIDAIAAELSGRALRWDLAQPDALDTRLGELVEASGPVDLLVNCAGVMDVRGIGSFEWESASRLLRIDLDSPLRLMSLVTPSMIARREGAIVNVSSMAGLTPIRGCSHYGAAKAGLAMASEIARLELREHGVKVVTVYPGPVRSELERRARAQLPQTLVSRWLPTGDANELAELTLRALDEDRPRLAYPTAYALASRVPALAGRITAWLSPAPLET